MASTKRRDDRGPVIVVEQWVHRHGPDLWVPSVAGVKPAQRVLHGLRAVAGVLPRLSDDSLCVRSVWVRERGQWVPA
ncbi:hypothetical protein [Methylibium sp. Pch-M]|uniref:hypothetical protein n=1 Tax=Methylibium sp. Pch-M TaxID=2082386 RepID=UPI0010139002|nr:hypothetical protein [Methylibium sp. Pch-M]